MVSSVKVRSASQVSASVQGEGVVISVGVGINVSVGKMLGVAAAGTGPEGGVVGEASLLGGWKKVGAAVGAQAGRVPNRIKMNAETIRDVSRSAFIIYADGRVGGWISIQPAAYSITAAVSRPEN